MRIVSLVPSLTDTVCALGLQELVVGITGFCVKPPDIHRTATKIGGTKDPDLAAIAALKPTHILTNDEENKPEHIVACEKIAKTFRCFPRSVKEGLELLGGIGEFCGVGAVGQKFQAEAEQLYRGLKERGGEAPQTVVYFVWKDPYMVASADTYISEMLGLVQLENVVSEGSTRYPEISPADVAKLEADLLLFSSEPFPFRRRDIESFAKAWPGGRRMPQTAKIDGQMMSWYGITQLEALREMKLYLEGRDQKLIRPLKR